MSQRQTDWGDDDWGMPARAGQPKSGHGMNVLHNQTDHRGYGPVDNSYNNNFDDLPVGGPGAYSNDRLPPRSHNMDYGSRDKYGTPWYKKKLTWAVAALGVIIAIVVPVAVVVSRNKGHGNAYPDYTALNYTLLETCEMIPLVILTTGRQTDRIIDSGETFFDKFDYYTGYDPGMLFPYFFVHAHSFDPYLSPRLRALRPPRNSQNSQPNPRNLHLRHPQSRHQRNQRLGTQRQHGPLFRAHRIKANL